MHNPKSSSEELFTIQDKLLQQDRWCLFLIVLGMLAIGVFIWEIKQIEDLSIKKESPKRELQAVSEVTNAN